MVTFTFEDVTGVSYRLIWEKGQLFGDPVLISDMVHFCRERTVRLYPGGQVSGPAILQSAAGVYALLRETFPTTIRVKGDLGIPSVPEGVDS